MSDLDDLMARLDADPTMPHPGDLDTLIAYYRNLRAKKESGNYTRAKKPSGPKQEINLEKLGLVKPAVPSGFKRRV